MELKKIPTPLPQSKVSSGLVGSGSPEESRLSRRKKNDESGLVGFVNIGNSCYMNSTLQALSNCPPFCQYFVETFQPPAITGTPSSSNQSAAMVLTSLLKKVWASDRHPGHLSPRAISSAMKNRMFRGSQQQDAQEFLRCLLTQIHEEMGIQVPQPEERGGHKLCDHRDSMVSCDSDTSGDSHSSQSRLVGNSPLSKKRSSSNSSLPRVKLAGSTHNSPSTQSKLSKYSKIIGTSSAKSSVESIPTHITGTGSKVSLDPQEGVVEWAEGDVFVVDLTDRKVTLHKNYLNTTHARLSHDQGSSNQIASPETDVSTVEITVEPPSDGDQGEFPTATPPEGGGDTSQDVTERSNGEPATDQKHTETQAPPTKLEDPPISRTTDRQPRPPRTTSIVSEVFEGILESRVKCLACKKVSETREPFQDLSLPIPGRKEIAKFNSKLENSSGGVGGEGTGGGDEEEEEEERDSRLSKGFCTVWNYVTTLTRDLLVGPPTDLNNCLNAFFDTSELKGDNRYYCSHCKCFQNSLKEMSIAVLPEVLCIHLKRFRFDAYISTKISKHIRFPLTGLDLGAFMKQETHHTHLYDLNAVITHYGGAGGGHYVAFAKNSLRNSWYEFNDTRVYPVSSDTVLNAEGYVLFYRRIPPNDSQVLRSLDITSLLPGSGTTLPSPEVCYISRHWLHLLKHRAYPGAIFQYDFACRHGAVLPTLTMEDARSLAMCIRREVWEGFHQHYGGGPLVQKLEVCQECKGLLTRLNERRKEEKEAVHKVHSKEKRSVEDKKQETYLISLPWLQHWQKFIHCNTLEWLPPGAIDNTPLLQYSAAGDDHRIVLTEQVPFRKISQEVWQFFHGCYGAGPVVVTSLEPINNTNNTDSGTS